MKYDPTNHHRQSIRLKGYNYSNAGAYFVTICTQNCACMLEDPILRGIITAVWQALPTWFPTIALDEFVVMPNHIHFIVWLTIVNHAGATHAAAQGLGAGASPVPTMGWTISTTGKGDDLPTLGDVVGGSNPWCLRFIWIG